MTQVRQGLKGGPRLTRVDMLFTDEQLRGVDFLIESTTALNRSEAVRSSVDGMVRAVKLQLGPGLYTKDGDTFVPADIFELKLAIKSNS